MTPSSGGTISANASPSDRPRLAVVKRPQLLDRWLCRELVGPLLFGVAIFTLLLLTGGAMFDLVRKVVEKGLPLLPALKVLLLRLPGFLVYALPMAMLLGTLLTYSKLSSTNELIALRSIGVPAWRYVLPAVVFGLLFSLCSYAVSDMVVPSSNLNSTVLLRTSLGKTISNRTRENIIYPHFARIAQGNGERRQGLAQLFYARQVEDDNLQGVTILDFSRPEMLQVVQAEEARYDDDPGFWLLRNGHTTSLNKDGGYRFRATFDKQVYPIGDGPLRLSRLPVDSQNMTVAQTIATGRLFEEAGDWRQARKLQVRFQEKFSVPIACLVFGFVGAGIGAQPSARSSRTKGFGISLMVIFGYYLLSFIFSSFGVKGTLPPLLAAWTPVAIAMTCGAVLLARASR